MRTKFSILILLAVLLPLGAQADLFGRQITFVPSPPPRNQQAQQGQAQQGQGQQQGQPKQPGLSPEKKKSLAKYGPEDVFPGAREQDDNQRPARRSTRQSSSTTASRTPTPMPTATIATPILAVASPTPPPAILTAATPAVAMATGSGLAQPPVKNPSSSSFVPIALGAASLLVLGALIYVVGVLRKKLREGR